MQVSAAHVGCEPDQIPSWQLNLVSMETPARKPSTQLTAQVAPFEMRSVCSSQTRVVFTGRETILLTKQALACLSYQPFAIEPAIAAATEVSKVPMKMSTLSRQALCF